MRKKLVWLFVYAMREAENVYLERPDFDVKRHLYSIIEELKFTKAERKMFETECNALGI
jgi:hypothetical protein